MPTQPKWTRVLALVTGLGTALLTLPTPAKAQFPLPHVIRPQRSHPPIVRPGGEQHPNILKALRNLQAAKSNLQHASHDYAGHREQAQDLVQRAIDQCKEALASDKG